MRFLTLILPSPQEPYELRWMQLSHEANELTLKILTEDGSETADISNDQWPVLTYNIESKTYAILEKENAAAIIAGLNTQKQDGRTVWHNFSAEQLITIISLLNPEENATAIIAGFNQKNAIAVLDYLLEHEDDYPRFTLTLIFECQLSLNSTQRSLLHRKFTTKQTIASDADFSIEIKDIEQALHVHDKIRSHEFFSRYISSENRLIKTLRSLVTQAKKESSTPISTSWCSIAALPDFEKFKNSTCINLLQKIGESTHTTINCPG